MNLSQADHVAPDKAVGIHRHAVRKTAAVAVQRGEWQPVRNGAHPWIEIVNKNRVTKAFRVIHLASVWAPAAAVRTDDILLPAGNGSVGVQPVQIARWS